MIQRLLRWLYPGMGVKRWGLVIAIFSLFFILGLMGLLGRDILGNVLRIFETSHIPVWSLVIGFIVIGTLGILFGVNGLIRTILRAVAPDSAHRTSELMYSQRLLSRGPSVVAIGGGTGLSTLLRGLKEWTTNITAVVTVMDDGGSSGKLRRERQILPPGDIRNCLIALAEDESKIAELFQHRFEQTGSALDGHSIGNLVLAGLQEMKGSFDRSIEELSKLLNVRGRVLPATLEDVELVAEMADGSLIRGECNIADTSTRIVRMSLSKPRVEPYPKVLEAIETAEVIVLGPGSLYTSIIPNLLVDDIASAVEKSNATKIYVANLMTQPGETDDFTLSQHLEELGKYIELDKLDHIIVNVDSIPEEILARYKADQSTPVLNDYTADHKIHNKITEAHLLDLIEIEGVQTVKHHSQHLTQAIAKSARQPSQPIADRVQST